jgi:hypothetical protein
MRMVVVPMTASLIPFVLSSIQLYPSILIHLHRTATRTIFPSMRYNSLLQRYRRRSLSGNKYHVLPGGQRLGISSWQHPMEIATSMQRGHQQTPPNNRDTCQVMMWQRWMKRDE